MCIKLFIMSCQCGRMFKPKTSQYFMRSRDPGFKSEGRQVWLILQLLCKMSANFSWEGVKLIGVCIPNHLHSKVVRADHRFISKLIGVCIPNPLYYITLFLVCHLHLWLTSGALQSHNVNANVNRWVFFCIQE